MFLSVLWHAEPGAVVGPTLVSIFGIAMLATLLVEWWLHILAEAMCHSQCFRRRPAIPYAPFQIVDPRSLAAAVRCTRAAGA